MTETLYQRVARTGGLPEETGPLRAAVLRRAGAEAARVAMDRLSVAETHLLVRALLPDGEQSWERLLPAAISLWCAARWDGAAPMPRDEAVRRLLYQIAFNEFPPPPKRSNRWLAAIPVVVVFAIIGAGIVLNVQKQTRLREAHEAKAAEHRAAILAATKPAPVPTYLPTTLPAPAPLPNPAFDGLREDWERRWERQEREDLLLELRTLRDDISAERRLLELDRLDSTRY